MGGVDSLEGDQRGQKDQQMSKGEATGPRELSREWSGNSKAIVRRLREVGKDQKVVDDI